MIRKTKHGYRVVAKSGRNMGTYRRREDAEYRLAQIEAFKAQRYQHSPTKRLRKPRITKSGGAWRVLASSGRSMGNYASKEQAMRRKAQLEAQAVAFFTKVRGYTKRVRGAQSPKREGRLASLRRELPRGVTVETWSPGDGQTRYRFFRGAPSKQTYFGPDNGIYTALGFKEAEAFASGLRR